MELKTRRQAGQQDLVRQRAEKKERGTFRRLQIEGSRRRQTQIVCSTSESQGRQSNLHRTQEKGMIALTYKEFRLRLRKILEEKELLYWGDAGGDVRHASGTLEREEQACGA